ncbi:MAG: hypothetical protein H6700_05225 [Myxococcales bacterium]|nr:hypothetical protein [Myxococcales bacterium]
MTVIVEAELEFTFDPSWATEHLDSPGRVWPKGISPVDFVVDRGDDLLLIEVKDPSHSRATPAERTRFIREMTSRELTHERLAPKARTSWSYLYLMDRTEKPLVFVFLVGTDALTLEPVLLQSLNDRLRARLAQETEHPWARPYVVSSVVLPALDAGRYIPGLSVTRRRG